MVRTHPPTFVGIAAALVAAVVTDLRPFVEDALPALGDESITLIGVLIVGIVGGLIGKFAERYTMPWMEIEDGREDEEIFDDEELI